MEQERVFCPQTGQERIARPRRINIPTVRAAPLELPGDPQSQLYFLGTWHDHFTFAGPFLISGKNLKTIYNIMYSISDKKNAVEERDITEGTHYFAIQCPECYISVALTCPCSP